MKRTNTRILTGIALVITLWLIWSRLHIVVLVTLPWWGLLILAVALFLALDYVLASLFKGR